MIAITIITVSALAASCASLVLSIMAYNSTRATVNTTEVMLKTSSEQQQVLDTIVTAQGNIIQTLDNILEIRR